MVVRLDNPMVKRDDTAVKVDTDVVKQARIVATHRGITVAEYLSGLLRNLVATDYRSSLAEMARGIEPETPAPPRPKSPKR